MSNSTIAIAAAIIMLVLFAGAGALWAQWGEAAYLTGAMRFCF